MIWRKAWHLITRNESGLTFIELIVSVAIVGIVMVGFTGAFFQTMKVTAASNNHLQAVRQVQNAGEWINRDGQKAQSVLWEPSVNKLTLTCQDVPSQPTYTIVYTLNGTQLTRKQGNVTQTIAEDITFHDPDGAYPDGVSGTYSTGYWVPITATVGGYQPESETLIYTFKPRPAG